jgi:hypothetical protein
MTNGQEELTDPFELKLPRLPIIRVMGREVWIGDRRVRFGLVRFARDPQRLKNYYRSVVAELLMGAQRANFVAQAAAVKGRTGDWPNTLVYNDGAEKPQEITGTNLSNIANEAENCAQDMKETTGIYEAGLGQKSNETSGVAIQRRQHEGDIATVGFHDNMNAALEEGGEVVNALLDVTHDTARTARLMGEDGAVRMQRLNDPNDPEAVDLSIGRYDTIITTGPAYMNRKQEAAAGMLEFARAAPGIIERAGDLIAKSQDWPMAEEFAERLQPPGVVDEEDMTPEQQQAAAAAKQQQAQAQQMEMAAAQAELTLKQQQARKAEADADKAEAEAEKARLEVTNMKKDIALEGAELAGLATGEIVPQLEPQEDIAA